MAEARMTLGRNFVSALTEYLALSFALSVG